MATSSTYCTHRDLKDIYPNTWYIKGISKDGSKIKLKHTNLNIKLSILLWVILIVIKN